MRTVICKVLKTEAEGLDEVPYPGEIGQRIYESVSKQGWQEWLQRLTIILNENRLSTADAGSVEVIEQHMLGFLFGEGDRGHLPSGFNPNAGKK